MRRSLFATISFCALMSAGAQAAIPNQDARPFEVNIPNLRGGFDFSVTLGYLETNYHNTGVVVIDSTTEENNPKGLTDYIEICEQYGYGAMVGYKFQNTGNDIRASFFSFDVDDTQDNDARSGQYWIVMGNVDDEDFLHRADTAKTRFSFDMCAYDIEAAQHINLGCRAGLRLLAGVSFHKVKKSSQAGYSKTDVIEGDDDPITIRRSLEATLRSGFDGIGPRVGFDFDYLIGCNFGFIAHASSALLVGSICSRTTIRSGGECVEIKHGNRCVTVPQYDLRLGFDYSYCLNPHEVIRAELGYWVRHYYDAINEIHIINGNNNANYINNLNGVTFNGCYLTVAASL